MAIVDNVISGTIITSVWGNSVADAINMHEDDIIAIEADITALSTDVTNLETNLATLETSLNNHLTDAVGAHAGSSISVDPLGLAVVTTTDVQAALGELDAHSNSNATNLASHIADTLDAHDASAVSFDPTGLLVLLGTDVQVVIEEIDSALNSLIVNVSAVELDVSDLQSASTDLQDRVANVGDIVQTINETLPSSRWWWLDGSTKINAQVTHPDAWAAFPVSWRSGSDIVLPNADDKVLMGETGIPGAEGGSTSVTIASNNLPPHAHALPLHTHTSGTLEVDIDHDHPSVSGTLPNHVHSDTHIHDVDISIGGTNINQLNIGTGSSASVGAGRIQTGAGGVLDERTTGTRTIIERASLGRSTPNTGNPTTNPSIAVNLPPLGATPTDVTGVTGNPSGTLPDTGDGGFANNALTLPSPPYIKVRTRIYAGA